MYSAYYIYEIVSWARKIKPLSLYASKTSQEGNKSSFGTHPGRKSIIIQIYKKNHINFTEGGVDKKEKIFKYI